MSFLDSLRRAKNYLSGGGAELQIKLDSKTIHSNSRVGVSIFCAVKEHELFIDKLYLKIRAEETVRYKDYGNYSGSHHHHQHHGQTRTQTVATFKQELTIDENFRLDPNGEYHWEAEFFIPANSYGTYRGGERLT